jgi:hypothetical protein
MVKIALLPLVFTIPPTVIGLISKSAHSQSLVPNRTDPEAVTNPTGSFKGLLQANRDHRLFGPLPHSFRLRRKLPRSIDIRFATNFASWPSGKLENRKPGNRCRPIDTKVFVGNATESTPEKTDPRKRHKPRGARTTQGPTGPTTQQNRTGKPKRKEPRERLTPREAEPRTTTQRNGPHKRANATGKPRNTTEQRIEGNTKGFS